MDDLRKLLIDYTDNLNEKYNLKLTINDIEDYIYKLKSISDVNKGTLEYFENQFKNSENE